MEKIKNSEEDYGMESQTDDTQRTSRNIWEDEVLNVFKKLKVKNWTSLFKDRKVWCELVQKTKTHKGL